MREGNVEEAKALAKVFDEGGGHGSMLEIRRKAGGSRPVGWLPSKSRLLREAEAGNYWAKYRLWAGYHEGADGIAKNPEEAKKWLDELVKDAYLAKFRPVNGFAPKTPHEFLANFKEHSPLQSEPTGLGGASFFRTKNKDGMLIGSFLTAYPDKMRKAIANNPSLELISIEKLTPEMFVRLRSIAAGIAQNGRTDAG